MTEPCFRLHTTWLPVASTPPLQPLNADTLL